MSGTSRDATATGTVAGATLSASDLQFASIAKQTQVKTGRCIGTGC